MRQKRKYYCIDCSELISYGSKRCKKCAGVYREKNKRNTQQEQLVVDMYKKGVQQKIIAKKMKKSTGWIRLVLDRNNVQRKHITHKYDLNEDVFSIDTPEKYYLLGLFSTDGYVTKNRDSDYIRIGLKRSDEVLLNDIRKIFKTNKPLYYDKEMVSLVIYSSKMVKQLNDFGITPRKTYNLKIKNKIPSKYIINFLHGCFDGDGSISKLLDKAADICLCYTVSYEFAKQLVDLYASIGFKVKLYSSGPNSYRNTKIYFIKKVGKSGLRILRSFYAQKSLFLPRKYEIYLLYTRLTVDEYMLELAHTTSLRSTCNRAHVGCIITNKEKTQIVSMGYNGQARGLENHCKSIFPGECKCLHAETNALIKSTTFGPILYCTTLPCPNCATAIINAGIQEIYVGKSYRKTDSIEIFKRAGIKLTIKTRRSYLWKLSWQKDNE